MKTLRFLLIGVFVFSTPITVSRAAPQHTVGFIPLLPGVDPGIPVEVQTHEALHRIMPWVLAAQKGGQINAFEPDLSAGVLKVLFAGEARITQFAGMPVYAQMEDAMVKSPTQYPAYTRTASPTFNIPLYNSCFNGNSLGDGTRVVGKLFSGAQLVAVSDGYADAAGYLADCFGPGFRSGMLPGYKLVFKLYDGTTNALLGSYTARIPNIKFTVIDKARAIVSGTGPANKPFDVHWYHRNLDAGDTYIQPTLGGTISGAGAWSVDFANPPTIRGNDYLTTYVYLNPQFTFYRYMYVPAIYCQLGDNHCEIYGFAFTPATLKIVRGATAYTFKGKFNAWGVYQIELEQANGAPIFTRAGDKLSGTSVPSYTLPAITASVDFLTNVVSGKAPARKYFEVSLLTLEPHHWYYAYTRANSSGYYSIDFTSQVDLDPARPITVEIYYTDKASGNATDYYGHFTE